MAIPNLNDLPVGFEINRKCPCCRVWNFQKVEPRIHVTMAWQAVCANCVHTWPCRVARADRLYWQKHHHRLDRRGV